jgi:protein-arginine kinase activator protein McsA
MSNICKSCKKIFSSMAELQRHACPEQYDEMTLKDLVRVYNNGKKAA